MLRTASSQNSLALLELIIAQLDLQSPSFTISTLRKVRLQPSAHLVVERISIATKVYLVVITEGLTLKIPYMICMIKASRVSEL